MFRMKRKPHATIQTILRASACALALAAVEVGGKGARPAPDDVEGGPVALVLIATPDINQDHKADLVVTNLDANAVSVYLNTTPAGADAPTFADAVPFAVGLVPEGIAVADFNGDGRTDVATANVEANNVSVLLNTTAQADTTPGFAAQQVFETGIRPFALTVADINDDGKPDLILTLQEGAMVVLVNTTAPGASEASFAVPQAFATEIAPVDVTTADIDGDGRPDVIVANLDSQTVSVFINTTPAGSSGATFASEQPVGVGLGPIRLASADLNADGKADLVVSNELSNTFTVLLNTTELGDAPSFVVSAFATPAPWAITTGDIDGDGLPDVILTNQNPATESVFINRTVPGSMAADFASARALPVPAEPDGVTVADLNGDGSIDAIVGSVGVRTFTTLLNARLRDPVFSSGFE